MDNSTIPVKNANEDRLNNAPWSRTAADERPLGATHPAGSTADEVASFVGRKTEDAVSYVGKRTEDAASYAGDKAQDAVSFVGHKAEDAASYVGQKTAEAGAAVGSGLRSLGHTVRDQGPARGMAGDASSAVADGLDRSGRYLQQEGIEDMTADLSDLIRRNPLSALIIGVAAGYLVGKAMSPRS